MPIKILMPALSPTMTEGTLATWHVKEGDQISSGDLIAEIETDKATMEVEAVDEGTIGKILVDAGSEGVAVNSVIAMLLEDGEDASALDGADLSGGPAPVAASAETAAPAAPAAGPAPVAASATASGGRVKASPLARRMAKQKGLDLSQISGSGPHGRIIKRDVENAKPAAAPAAAAQTAAPAPVASAVATASASKDMVVAQAGGIGYEEKPHSNMRKTIARRLTEAKQTVPHFYLTVECELDALLKTRKQLNERSDSKISVNDFIIKAAALALKKVPDANASWSDEAILKWQDIDISVAVSIDDGLITPIIKNADQKGMSSISAEMKDLAGRARDGKLKPAEYQGGTFSVSNLGMFGIKEFSAIINPPQSCILAVGAGEQKPVVKDGALTIATVMNATLSVDHRVVDGALGAQLLAEFKKLIEDPLSMML